MTQYKHAPSYAHAGENDVILLSKTPFTNAGSVLFRDSPSNSWGAVFGSTKCVDMR